MAKRPSMFVSEYIYTENDCGEHYQSSPDATAIPPYQLIRHAAMHPAHLPGDHLPPGTAHQDTEAPQLPVSGSDVISWTSLISSETKFNIYMRITM